MNPREDQPMRGMTCRWTRWRGAAADDQGIALAMVLLITVAISGLIAAMVIIGTGALRSSTGHAKFDQSLAAAEAGIDSLLSELQADQAFTNAGSVPSSWATTPPTEAEEQAWARAAILAQDSSAVQDAGVGEYVAIKPAGWNVVYAMGWSPSKAAPNATARLIKAEYLFAPYKPGNAILTVRQPVLLIQRHRRRHRRLRGRQGQCPHQRRGSRHRLLADGERHGHLQRHLRRLRHGRRHRIRGRIAPGGRPAG